MFSCRFYSTYEELKLPCGASIFYCTLCFYSTYEELKRSLCPQYMHPSAVFLQYLWGIETNVCL